MKKIIASFLTFSLLALSCQFFTPTASSPLTQTANVTKTPISNDWNDRSIFKDGLVPAAQPILEKLEGASVYHLEIYIDSDMAHISGSEEVRYTNTEGTPLTDVRFRLFPNILGGNITVEDVTVDGESTHPSYGLEKSLLIVPFAQPLQPGASVIISMDFKVKVAQSVKLNYGVEAFYDDVLALAHAYPMIAVFDDEGWNAEIPPQYGDVTYADMSFFLVKVTAPTSVTLVTSGRQIRHEEDGSRQTVTVEAGPVRDFYLAASPDYQFISEESNGVTFRFYTQDAMKNRAREGLKVAIRAVEDFSQRYAPYPYTELDLVATPTLALGIEYPGMIAITARILEQDARTALEATVAHEVGHQWFYNLVGNDQLDDPWLDESLTQFVTLQYFTDQYGEPGNFGFRQDLEFRWASLNNADIPVGLPVAEYSAEEYNAIVYGRGALFFDALRDEIGQDTFDAFIKDYTETLAWNIATPENLKQIAEKHCSCDLTPLFEEWIY